MALLRKSCVGVTASIESRVLHTVDPRCALNWSRSTCDQSARSTPPHVPPRRVPLKINSFLKRRTPSDRSSDWRFDASEAPLRVPGRTLLQEDSDAPSLDHRLVRDLWS